MQNELRSSFLAPFLADRATAVSEIIDYDAGPVVSRTSALEALNSSHVDLDAAAAVR